MKKIAQSFVGVAATAGLLLSTPLYAGPINVGGVVWDPDSFFDFNATAAPLIQVAGNPLSGYGIVNSINLDGQTTFCPTCELTIEFGGFLEQTPFPTVATGAFEYKGGFVNIWVDAAKNFNAAAGTGYNDGTLWLSLVADSIFGVDQNATFSNTTLAGLIAGNGATGKGLLSVTGGLAKANFDTNTQATGSDLNFQNSFTANSGFRIGSGNFGSDSTTVPEPSSIALLGLGLLGMSRFRRKAA